MDTVLAEMQNLTHYLCMCRRLGSPSTHFSCSLHYEASVGTVIHTKILRKVMLTNSMLNLNAEFALFEHLHLTLALKNSVAACGLKTAT